MSPLSLLVPVRPIDPQQWSNGVVQLWLQTMSEQLNLSPLETPIGVAFPENGSQFYNLTEKEFLQKAPLVSTGHSYGKGIFTIKTMRSLGISPKGLRSQKDAKTVHE